MLSILIVHSCELHPDTPALSLLQHRRVDIVVVVAVVADAKEFMRISVGWFGHRWRTATNSLSILANAKVLLADSISILILLPTLLHIVIFS